MPVEDSPATTPRRKRLLLISQYFPVEAGGAEHQVYFLARYFRSRMEIHYLTISDRCLESGDPEIRMSTIPRRRLLQRVLGRYYPLDYFPMMRVLRRIRPDVIYLQDARAHLGIAARYARLACCTLIWHISSAYQLQGFRLRSLRTVPFDYLDKKMMEYGVRHAHHIFGQAQYEDELLQRTYGRKCDLIVGNWHPEPLPAGGKDGRVKVVWIANVKPVKRPEVFVDLAARLGSLTDAQFIMMGRPAGGRYQRRLETRMQGVSNLRYVGEMPLEEVNRILAETHILVNTSDYEGFPNTFVQAWLREVPVVSLQVDPDDLLTKEGLGFHSGDFETLVRDTQRLIADDELRAQMGRRARAYAREHHSLAGNLDKVAPFLGVQPGSDGGGDETS
jgi:glycosyltransferase involved in cell wall biosynthesis